MFTFYSPMIQTVVLVIFFVKDLMHDLIQALLPGITDKMEAIACALLIRRLSTCKQAGSAECRSMNLHFRIKSRQSVDIFEDEFARIVVKSERTRALILALYAIIIGLTILAGYLFSARYLENQRQVLPVFRLGIGLMAFLFVYEGGLYLLLDYYFRKRKSLPERIRIMNSLFEVSLPTLGIYIMSRQMPAPYALQSPAVFAYFIFIVLSALRLNWQLSLWTGFVAALEHLGLSLYLIANTSNLEQYMEMLTSPVQYVGRTVIILLGGAATAFVSYLISKRIQETISYVDELIRSRKCLASMCHPRWSTGCWNKKKWNPKCAM